MSGRIVIVGGGASAVAVTVALARATGGAGRATVVERGARPGRGIAYDAAPGLRVNASKIAMSIDADRPDDLVAWLAARGLADDACYVERDLYGAYLQERLLGAGGADVVRGAVVDVVRAGDRWRVELEGAAPIDAAAVVLAVGHAAPTPLVPSASGLSGGRWITRVWGPDALKAIGRNERVLVIGTGLTAADVLVQLRRRAHEGAIVALSRLGTWPIAHPAVLQAHTEAVPAPGEPPDVLLDLVSQVSGSPQAASWADAVRARLPALWAAWSPAERAIFAERGRGAWDRIRHRLPASVLDEVRALERIGRLRTLAGTVTDVAEAPDALAVTLRTGSGEHVEPFDRVVQCTGPAVDPVALGAPVTAMLARGDVVADAGRIGLVTDTHLRLVGRGGRVWADLLAIGPITRPLAWETIGVPEIVGQSKVVAATIAEAIGQTGR